MSRWMARASVNARSPAASATNGVHRRTVPARRMRSFYTPPAATAPFRPGDGEPEGGIGALFPGVEGGKRRVELARRQEAAADDRPARAPPQADAVPANGRDTR